MTLACLALRNICIDRGDTTPKSWDLNYDDNGAQRRPHAQVREMLKMRACPPLRGSVNRQASTVRKVLKKSFGVKSKDMGFIELDKDSTCTLPKYGKTQVKCCDVSVS